CDGVEAELLEAWNAARAVEKQQAHQAVRQRHAAGAGDRPEHDALGKELTDHAPSSCAEGRSHRELLTPAHGADREETADVGAGNRQQREHGGEPEPHTALRVFADDIVEERDDADIEVLVALVGISEARGDETHLRSRVIERAVRYEPADDLECIAVTLEARYLRGIRNLPEWRCGDRPPQLRITRRNLKRVGHHADDRVRLAVNHHRLAERIGRPCELLLPETLAQHDHAIATIEVV